MVSLEGDSNKQEFIAYCDGKNTLYIYELRQALACKTLTVRSAGGVQQGVVFDRTGMKKLARLGVFTVAKIAPSAPRYTVGRPSPGALALAESVLAPKRKAFEAGVYQDYLASFALTGRGLPVQAKRQYDRARQAVARSPLYKMAAKARVIKTQAYEFIVLPLGVDLMPEMDATDWDLRTAVLMKQQGRFVFLGEISGCIDRIFDLKQTGIPEIGASTCVNSEGESQTYWQIYPEIKWVLSRS